MTQVTNTTISIRLLTSSDIPIIVSAFKNLDWQIKPASIFEQYLGEQNNDRRICFVAFIDYEFAGYVTLKWQSDYKILQIIISQKYLISMYCLASGTKELVLL